MNCFVEIFKYIIEILALFGVVIEVTPVKFSPIKWIGDRLNGQIKEELNAIKKDLYDLRVQVDRNDIRTIRSRICSFENLVRLDKGANQLQKHQYTTIFKDIDKWNRYHDKYDDLNGELKLAIKTIEEAYQEAKFSE